MGQPIIHIEGYVKSMCEAAIAINDVHGPKLGALVYRQHPKEPDSSKKIVIEKIKRITGTTVLEDGNLDSHLGSLCGADVVISCFSAVGEDLIFLSRISQVPLPISVHLLFEPSIVQACAKGGIPNGPINVEAGFGINVKNYQEIRDVLKKASQKNQRYIQWKKAQRLMVPAKPPSSAAVETIIYDLKAG